MDINGYKETDSIHSVQSSLKPRPLWITMYNNAYYKNVENVNVGLKMLKECFDWFL